MAGASLRFHGLRRGFGDLRVLDGVSGAAGAGEVLLVTGPNGSGKSTLLRCLAGLLAPEGGTVDYREGADRSLGTEARRHRVGYLAPDLWFYEELTVRENLEFFARLRGVVPQRARALLERVGLPGGRAAGALSSGMQQRLRWAWALLHSPRLLLLDEPLQNLDPPGEELARALLAEHLEGGGLAVVASPSPPSLPGAAAHLELGG